MKLDFGEYWIYKIEFVRENSVFASVRYSEKVKDLKKFENDFENEINEKLENKIQVQAVAKRSPTKEQYYNNVNKVGKWYYDELMNGGCNYQQVSEKFGIALRTVKDYIDKYFEINKIGTKK